MSPWHFATVVIQRANAYSMAYSNLDLESERATPACYFQRPLHDLPALPGCLAFLGRTQSFGNSLDYFVSDCQKTRPTNKVVTKIDCSA